MIGLKQRAAEVVLPENNCVDESKDWRKNCPQDTVNPVGFFYLFNKRYSTRGASGSGIANDESSSALTHLIS